MAKVSYVEVPPEMEQMYYKTVMPNDRFYNSRIVRKNTMLSRPRKSSLKSRSLLPAIKDLWNGFDAQTKALWTAIRPYSGYTGYSSFVQDQTLRMKYEMGGISTPSIYKNGKCGVIVLTYPDSEIKLFQPHPNAYFVKKKKTGTKSQYEMRQVSEVLTLPLKIAISYKSDLTATEEPYIAEIYAVVLSDYQGVEREQIVKIDFELQSDWQRQEVTMTSVLGQLRSYNVFIHLKNVVGTLKFDNIVIEHSGQNWARDKRCNHIDQEFTRQYFNVPKHWVAEYEGVNTTWYSDYHEIEI
jgi:hypothetical protein